MSRIRVALVAGNPVYYRAPLYRLVAAAPEIELTAFFASSSGARPGDQGYGRPVAFDVDAVQGYDARFLKRAATTEVEATSPFGLFDPDIVAEIRRGDFDVLYNGWSGRVDPDGNLHQFVTCKAALNDSGYCNPEVDKLLNEARQAPDEAARKQKYDAAMAVIQDDMPMTWIGHQSWIWAMSKKVTGYVIDPFGLHHFETVDKSE